MARKRRRTRQTPEMGRRDSSTTGDPQIRFLFVVARPIRKAARLKLSWLSDGSFPFCHWGLFVSQYNNSELFEKMSQISREMNDSEDEGLGTMFELQNTPQGNKPHVFREFRVDSWEQAVFAYVGETKMSDEEISDHGIDPEFRTLIDQDIIS